MIYEPINGLTIFRSSKNINNLYYFDFFNRSNFFLDICECFFNLVNTKIEPLYIDLCTLFEFMTINYTKYLIILNGNSVCEDKDILSFYNVNTYLIKNVSFILNKLEINNYIIDLLDINKRFLFIKDINTQYKMFKRVLIEIFYKILNDKLLY